MQSLGSEPSSHTETCFPIPSSSNSLNVFQRAKRALPRFQVPHVANYIWCVTFTAIGGFLFGFDTGSIGPITTMHTFQDRFAADPTHGITPTLQGLIVSSILITASLASVASGPLSDRISRTKTISMGAAVFAAGSAVTCSANGLPQLFAGRCLADATWIKLGVSAADAEKTEENAERSSVPRESVWKEAQQLWSKNVRARTVLGVFLMGMQQLSGIDGVLYYAPLLFTQAGLSGQQASFIASGVTGLVTVACTISVQFFADTWSRRVSMISGGSIIATCMLVIGTLYATNASDTDVGRWVIIVLIYVFVVGFSCTWAIVTRIIASEIQPMRTRAAATSLGQCMNWLINWIIAFSTPLFLAHSSSGPYFLFGACTLLTTFVCLAFQPETRGASLEEVDKAFEVSPWKAALNKRKQTRRRQSTEEGQVIALAEIR
ncbi:hypothetical protein EUX98_g3608 [Antrodiella citrinella]|uniref:Major facilitator superfamily (MFS) profile domain-containing protein n=1 Tax=Antrodiella citrinella TaxID=2447956 RepID=A0A4S4MW35_9APHY|nr:hypothetical protein EUX98_g3608 [Antrodiella citrinella]